MIFAGFERLMADLKNCSSARLVVRNRQGNTDNKRKKDGMNAQTTTIAAKELRDIKKAFFMLRGLFDASKEYAERIESDDANQKVLINNLVMGQMKAQEYFAKAKALEEKLQ